MMTRRHLGWLGAGVAFWGLAFSLGELVLGHFVKSQMNVSLFGSLGFYLAATLVLTLAFQDLIGGFISEWPSFTWFFWPLVSLAATGVFCVLM
jgi:hypothetical protein